MWNGFATPVRSEPSFPVKSDGSPHRDGAGCELAEEVLCSSGRLRLKVNGSSMLPAIWPGDIITIVRDGLNEASIGDVVLFGREGRLVAHRIIRRTSTEAGPQWTTRGDSLARADWPVLSTNELLGRVTAIARGSRQLAPRQAARGRLIARVCAHSDLATRIFLKAHKTWLEIGKS
jgi:signal peptidase I